MTNQNNAVQAAMQQAASDADLLRICQQFNPGQDMDLAKAVRALVLSQVRAPVADERAAFARSITGRDDLEPYQVENVIDANRSRWKTWKDRAALASAPVAGERADDTLTQVYDAFGIGVLARRPSTLMACLGNAIRRSRCLSQVERVLSVPTPPEPEDDGVWGDECLLRWGADEKDYAEHFKAALAEWSRRIGPASVPVAGEAVAWTNDAGDIEPISNALKQARPDRYSEHYTRPLVYAAPQASAEDGREALAHKVNLLTAESLGHRSATGRLSVLADELRGRLIEARQAMTDIQQALVPAFDTPETLTMIPNDALAPFCAVLERLRGLDLPPASDADGLDAQR